MEVYERIYFDFKDISEGKSNYTKNDNYSRISLGKSHSYLSIYTFQLRKIKF